MKYLLPLLLAFNVVTRTYGSQTKRDLTGHVVGGVDVPIFMYPHVAQLFYEHWMCGGSIISNRVILTAAHCLFAETESMDPKKLVVHLGSDVLKGGSIYDVCKIVPHDMYQGEHEEKFYYYDVGLVLLSKNIKFGPTIKKANIAKTESFRNVKYSFTIAGFGAITNLFPSGPSKTLKATRMYFVNTKACNESQSYRDIMEVPDHMFCMIGQGWTSDCFGDSGSGIIWRSFLVGLVSTGRDNYCGSDMLPSMYTDLVYFRKWVTAKVSELESTRLQKNVRNLQ